MNCPHLHNIDNAQQHPRFFIPHKLGVGMENRTYSENEITAPKQEYTEGVHCYYCEKPYLIRECVEL
jgi:hypothetical protein